MRILALCLGLLASGTLAAEVDLNATLEQKLAKEFVKNADWELDFDTALKKATDSNKLIFAYFTRSYAP